MCTLISQSQAYTLVKYMFIFIRNKNACIDTTVNNLPCGHICKKCPSEQWSLKNRPWSQQGWQSVPQRELDEWTMFYCSCIAVPDSSLKDEVHLVLLCNYLKTTLVYGNPRFRKLGILLWLNMCDFIYIYRWIYILSLPIFLPFYLELKEP